MRQKRENQIAKRSGLNRRSGSQEKPTSTPLIAKLLTSPHLHQYSNEQVFSIVSTIYEFITLTVLSIKKSLEPRV